MDKKIRMGVVGCGGFGCQHILNLNNNERAEVVALCDTNTELLDRVADYFKMDKKYTDIDDMLRTEDIDAVVVATNDQHHREMTVKALRAGKHVLCEKPMALTVEDCKEMIKAEKESGKKLMIGQICRMTPGFAEAKKMIDKGVIGELFYVESEYAHDYSSFTDASSWRADPLRHIVIGGGCHAIDLLRWMAGDPYETTCYSNKKMLKSLPTDDCAIAIFRFPNDVIGKVFISSGCKRAYTMRTSLYGTKGTIVVNNTDPFMTVYRERIVEGEKILDGVYEKEQENDIALRYPININNHNVEGEHKDFLDAIINDTPVATDGREGMATVAVCRAVIESADKHKTVEIKY